MRCALVHDWLTGMRGGEKVLEALCDALPGADLYTLIHVPGAVSEMIERRPVHTSWLNHLPNVERYYRWLLPFMPSAVSSMRLKGYDLVVASSHCVAHGVSVSAGTRLLSYCHTPMRYAWDTLELYFPGKRRYDPRYLFLKMCAPELRRWDCAAAERVSEFIANSENVRKRIKCYYGRNASVVYPPVDTGFYRPLDISKDEFYLWVGALTPYKRFDIAIEAIVGMGRKLVVIGEGQDMASARKNAPPNVSFLGRQPDVVLREYYQRSRALLFPGEEDFGIVPLEIQACGRPVIAYGRGGALETVVGLDESPDNKPPTGLFFHEQTAQSLSEAILRFEKNEHLFKPGTARANAERFSRSKCVATLKKTLLVE